MIMDLNILNFKTKILLNIKFIKILYLKKKLDSKFLKSYKIKEDLELIIYYLKLNTTR